VRKEFYVRKGLRSFRTVSPLRSASAWMEVAVSEGNGRKEEFLSTERIKGEPGRKSLKRGGV